MQIYPKSVQACGASSVSMLRTEDADFLRVTGPNPGFFGVEADGAFLAPLTHENADVLRRLFPFTAPKPVLGGRRTFGVGDRLGIATPAICAFLKSTTRFQSSHSSPYGS